MPIEQALTPDDLSSMQILTVPDVWPPVDCPPMAALPCQPTGFADSGGGGQITLGGSRPNASPFVRYPHVLPALIRYLNNHPSLSYWFASECVGSASQGPRPDEGARERWDELAITLAWLDTLADRLREADQLERLVRGNAAAHAEQDSGHGCVLDGAGECGKQ